MTRFDQTEALQVVIQCSLVGGETNINPADEGRMSSKTVVAIHKARWCLNPGDHNLKDMPIITQP